MPWKLDCHRLIKPIKPGLPRRLVRMTTTRRRKRRRRSPSTLHVHHHDGNTMMASECTKSFHGLRVDQIGKVWEVTLIVVLSNSMLTVMKILLLKLSLLFLPFMICMMLNNILLLQHHVR
jgi:hypothetical protein